jgi:hypothetical protein
VKRTLVLCTLLQVLCTLPVAPLEAAHLGVGCGRIKTVGCGRIKKGCGGNGRLSLPSSLGAFPVTLLTRILLGEVAEYSGRPV